MSEAFIDPSVSPPPAATSSRRAILIAAVAVASLLVGSALAVSAMYLLGWRPQPERNYTVLVFMKTDATTEQRAAVEQAVGQIPNAGPVEFTDRATSFAQMKEMFKDRPEVVEALTEKAAPESFKVPVKAREMTCDGITGIRQLPGVSDLKVTAPVTKSRPPLDVICF
ncbi:hypothetical protein JIG36_41105 [Actinoplanes sp. LDG1-06]|uniref:FtsX extracellular domain-containing protein n=1 Tax=Paractinoplanes ovalisporus TaxID=2810368 RepID=A0ABS2ARZ0_9ACTN|nr:permease-like cell division protein FtsX [Actinoplanes ovalisporus]MBM2621919.1 hypothetical protein [Actinoplanes ovalisporus]